MQPSLQVKNQSKDWILTKRVRVKDVVQHRNAYWTNTTGVNSEPSYTSLDWIFSGEAIPYFRGMKITKSLDTTGKGLQQGDKVDGFWDETYAFMGFFTGLDPDNLADYNIIQEY